MLRFLVRTGLRRGVMGGSRVWTAVGAAAIGLRLLKKLTANEPEVVFCTEMRPGETLMVSHDRKPGAIRSRS